MLPVACALEGPIDDAIADDGGDDRAAPSDEDDAPAPGDTASSSSGGPAEPECPHEGPAIVDVSLFEPCQQCGGGHCVPTNLIPDEFASQLGTCDADNYCVPDPFIETNNNFIPETCDSVGGNEGRCLSTCLPDVAAQAAALPQSSCGAGDVCVPCYDPLDLEPTGACELSCDPGPIDPPQGLPKCCGGIGSCVPESAVPSDKKGNLKADECSQQFGPSLCAPDVFISDPNYQPTSCKTTLLAALFGDEYEQGACLPECVDGVDSFLLLKDGCPDNFKCAPCLEPPFGQSSGACDL